MRQERGRHAKYGTQECLYRLSDRKPLDVGVGSSILASSVYQETPMTPSRLAKQAHHLQSDRDGNEL
jgi:hypothetical protein